MAGLQIQRLSSLKYKSLITSVAVFALLVQPVYGLINGAVANAADGKTILAVRNLASNDNCDRSASVPKCDSIQGAIAVAQNGDTVKLSGNFSPSSEIVVDKAITIDGNKGTVWGEFNTNSDNNSVFELRAPVTIQNISLRGKNRFIHGINAWHTNGDATVWNATIENFGKSGLNVGEGARVVAGDLTTTGNAWHTIDVDKGGSWLKLAGVNNFNEGSKVPVVYVDDRNVGQVTIDQPALYTYIDDTHHLLDATKDRIGDRAYFLQSSAPATPSLVAPGNNSVVRGTSLTNSWTAVSGVDHYVYESYNDATASSLRWRENFTTTSKTATNVADTTFWWRVKAVNSIGLSSTWSPLYKVTVDNTAPSVPTFTMYDASNNVITSNITTKDFKFVLSSSNDVVRYQLKYTNDITGASTTSWSPNDISATGHMATLGEYTDNFTQGEGVHHFSFSACDAAGNCSAFSAPFTVNYDKTGPALSADATPFRTTKNKITPSFTDNDGENSGNTYAWVGDSSNPDGDKVISNPAVLNPDFNITKSGKYTFTLTATDPAGNATVRTFTFTYSLPPVQSGGSTTGSAPVVNGGVTSSFTRSQQLSSVPVLSSPFSNVTVTAALPAQGNPAAAAVIGTSPENRVVAVSNQDKDILGLNDDQSSALSKPGVKGASTEKHPWYQWLFNFWYVILAAIIGVWWFIAAVRRRKQADEVQY